jgi:lipopolysaccharide export system protein LptA
MNSGNHNRLLQYQEHVVMWQGADRIMADRVEVDRQNKMIHAEGSVVTQFLEKKSENKDRETGKPGEKKSDAATRGRGGAAKDASGNAASVPGSSEPAPPVFVVVKAARLVYTDQDRLAHYTGGVLLDRPGLRVKADELRAVLAESKKDDKDEKASDEEQSRLEKAFADGHVEIVQTAADRTRTGSSDHAEYYTGDERILLRGGKPQMLDSKKGYTRGSELTYYVNDDRLLVSGGGPKERATGHLRRKQ